MTVGSQGVLHPQCYFVRVSTVWVFCLPPIPFLKGENGVIRQRWDEENKDDLAG